MRVLKTFSSFLTIVLSVVILAFAIGTAVLSFDGEAFLARIESAMHESEECVIQLEVNPGGKINYESGIYQNGEEIDLLATPENGYVFVGWYGSDNTLISTDEALSFTANHSLKLRATFAQAPNGSSTISYANTKSFRNIYQYYNRANANITQAMFEGALGNLFEADEEIKEIILTVVDSYTNNLFTQLEDMKAKEDENGTQENLFMATEPAAFNAMYTHTNSILQDSANYQPKKEEIVDMIDCISRSKTCIATIDNLVEVSQENTALADRFQSMSEEVKTVFADALITYKQTAEEGSSNSVVCQQIADLLGIDLS